MSLAILGCRLKIVEFFLQTTGLIFDLISLCGEFVFDFGCVCLDEAFPISNGLTVMDVGPSALLDNLKDRC